MSEFPEIRDALSAIFSIQIGLSDESANAMFRRALDNQDWRRRLEAELIAAFSSARTPWKALMCNEEYEVFEPESDAEARAFLAAILWEPTFPDRAVPVPS